MTIGYEDVFMQEIRESPADDLPRLIYADWLEDNGDAVRAEFIRVQIRIARAADDDPELPRLWSRERELLHHRGTVWRAPLSPWLRGWVKFRRGFIDEFDGLASAFYRDDLSVFFGLAPCPVLRLRGTTPAHLRRLRNSPYVAHLGGIELHNTSSTTDLLAALHLEKAVRLTELGLSNLHRWSLRNFLETNWVQRVERLMLFNCRLDDDSVSILLGWPHLDALKLLDLRENDFTARGIDRLKAVLGDRVDLSPSGE